MTEEALAAARDVADAMIRGGTNELKGEIMLRLCEEIERCHQALRECQADLVAAHGALPSWCGEGTLGERIASVVQQRKEALDVKVAAIEQARDANVENEELKEMLKEMMRGGEVTRMPTPFGQT